MDNLPPHDTTSGASAMSGTVCDSTRYGRIPRSATLNRAMRMESPRPSTVPTKKPTNARRNENHAPASTTDQIFRSEPRTSGRP
ncbi:unannotated protein [freshwater metagenome]|uniref:Unannotated protein n=1 Tax=freshwater metagenome TaxID=449393 RepID=A0A6J6FEQ5_9ZZZZ